VPGTIEDMLGAHFRLSAAIDAAWRRALRCTEARLPLGRVVGWVLEKCPDADQAMLRKEIERRFACYRPRRRRQYRKKYRSDVEQTPI
jgi:hypothetical protein